ncbi:MAG: hypothetical protein U0V74_13195 [Chitinophagales bacterium]
MKPVFLLLLVLFTECVMAQQPAQTVNAAYKNFKRLKDYSANVKMDFDIPSVRIKSIEGKVYFKQPNRFRVKTNGIIFLPNQNPYYALGFLADSSAYTAVATGTEKIGTADCKIITVIPLKEGEVVLCKLWIDEARSLILRTQLTTRTDGTIQMDNTFSPTAVYPTPDKILFTVDMTKFKVPKAIAVDINSKTTSGSYNQKSTGHITLSFTDYKINQNLSNSVFEEDKQQ